MSFDEISSMTAPKMLVQPVTKMSSKGLHFRFSVLALGDSECFFNAKFMSGNLSLKAIWDGESANLDMVVIQKTLSSLIAPEPVVMTTYGIASDG